MSKTQREVADALVRDWSDIIALLRDGEEIQAIGCGCTARRKNGKTAISPCRIHPNLEGTNWDLPSHLQERYEQAMRNRETHFQSPPATPSSTDESKLERLERVLIPWDRKSMGNARQWVGKSSTLDAPWNCGCTFLPVAYTVPGKWLNFRKSAFWFMFRIGSCGRPPGECKCEHYPIFNLPEFDPYKLTAAQILKWYRHNREE